jgi:hypothetical protein
MGGLPAKALYKSLFQLAIKAKDIPVIKGLI